MAAPMRSGGHHQQPDGQQGHRPRVADNCGKGATGASSISTSSRGPNLGVTGQQQAVTVGQQQNSGPSGGQQQQANSAATASATNFEYDDNEWDIGIGDLIIDLDADIEKTNDQQQHQHLQLSGAAGVNNSNSGSVNMAANAGGGPQASKNAATAKMHIEHSATADKGLKMKIKRTKPGTKTSEAKHEIVKSNEQNGVVDPSEMTKGPQSGAGGTKHVVGSGPGQAGAPGNGSLGNPGPNAPLGSSVNSNVNSASKRGSSGHRRDKTARDKHTERNVHNSASTGSNLGPPSQQNSVSGLPLASSGPGNTSKNSSNANPSALPAQNSISSGSIPQTSDMNGLLRGSAVQPARSVFSANTGPGPPPPSPGSDSNASNTSKASEQSKGGGVSGSGASGSTSGSASNGASGSSSGQEDHRTNSSTSPPPSKKLKGEPKETADVCVGTSVGTITEPDCLGPCEPGTSVTLEGIVWHETEGGVLVVNVTWRGKTYVGTLLDCTRHDWAPPRFCDSPISDLDNRTPKGRETRSSVHSKLRNGGGVKGGRRGVANGAGPANAPSSPTPFVPPRPDNKRKSRAGEEENPQNGKKAKVVVPPPVVTAPIVVTPAPCVSPPPSPVLLECPEPNCSKKYKHINGLKYHQSHAHGSVADDDDTKDVTSMSENDESNIEAPSPVTPVKSPEKSQDSPSTPVKKDSNCPTELPSLINNTTDSGSTPPSPCTPPSVQDVPPAPSVPASPQNVPPPDVAPGKPQVAVVKPAILRFGAGVTTDEFNATPPTGGAFNAHSGKGSIQGSPMSNSPQLIPQRSGAQQVPTVPSEQNVVLPEPVQPQSFTNQLPAHVNISPQQFTQPPNIIIPNQNTSNPQMQTQLSPHHPPPSPTQASSKLAQFKVKPTSALMPEEKKQQSMAQPGQNQNGANLQKPQSFKKKNRKSPGGSPHLSPAEPPVFGMEQSGRDEVQSPAYSDISDDGAPVSLDGDVDKNKSSDKKTEGAQPLPHMGQYGIYPYFSQSHQYVVPNQQQQPSHEPPSKPKEADKGVDKPPNEKEQSKKDGPEYPPQKMLQQHYYPYGYMPGYSYNMEPNYGGVPMSQDEKHKEERVKESPSPIERPVKQPTPISNTIQVPIAGKAKQSQDAPIKDKHQNENHQIIKESIEIKNQMNPYMYSRQPQSQTIPSPQQALPQHHGHRERDEDARRYYVYEQQRRKEHQHQQQQQQQQQQQHQQQNVPEHKPTNPNLNKMPVPQSPNIKTKEIKMEEKKEKEVKQEGVKPTMETQGPPPPPTSQYAYIHPSYMQGAHYGALPFDPSHPMYRGIMVPGPYSSSPYLHPQIPRYHAPEDLSRAQPPSKALDMLQHHAQYYSSHKIHELQERAIKSPTPKTSVASSSPSTNQPPQSGQSTPQMTAPPTTQTPNTTPSSGKQTPGENPKDSRSPPPQRHVHTHHHTHVGLGYPIYGAGPYGAAVLASQQAAAVTVINPYPTK
ncbi:zinc finger protein 608 [Anthonomus grandis grandis]|uniref:zinc finger protein 608 n=1 Tax=Anthonomus grandis grandis TaxID=2921223 RepID=UPI00216566B4|nr:zinc finger protein 608 [Anthonomus grandis grandis]